jgi:hypothetical protein
MSTILTIKGLWGALSLVTFFSRKRKLLARLLERHYEVRKAKACETIALDINPTSNDKHKPIVTQL